jgi:hypothetical protein
VVQLSILQHIRYLRNSTAVYRAIGKLFVVTILFSCIFFKIPLGVIWHIAESIAFHVGWLAVCAFGAVVLFAMLCAGASAVGLDYLSFPNWVFGTLGSILIYTVYGVIVVGAFIDQYDRRRDDIFYDFVGMGVIIYIVWRVFLKE